MSEQPSAKDDVRRGLGMLPQQALFAKAPKGDFAKMSEPVQVYTACQFVTKTQLPFLSLIFLFNDSVLGSRIVKLHYRVVLLINKKISGIIMTNYKL